MEIKVYRIRENAKLPTKAYKSDAGFDIYYCPEKESDKYCPMKIVSLGSVLLPTGIKIEFPSNIMVEIKNKGGIAAKKSLIVGSCVVDSGYDGEIFVNLHNIGYETQNIYPGDKIAQMVPIKIDNKAEIVEYIEEDRLNKNSQRKDGCLGSTDNK